MKTSFYILLSIRTAAGYESYGKLFIGNNAGQAYSLFRRLEGTSHLTGRSILHLELVETRDGLPFNIEMIGCTLDELAANSRIIAKEVFKIFNMEAE